jgi:hypothetical protein
MKRACLVGLVLSDLLAAGCLVEVEKEGGDQVLVWLR